MNVLITCHLEPDLLERIRTCVPGLTLLYDADLVPPPRYVADHHGPPGWRLTGARQARLRAWLAEAEVMFHCERDLIPLLAGATRLRWIQATSSGIGPLLRETGLDRTGIAVANAAGIHAVPLAEHALLAMLYFCKDVPRLRREQRARRWERYCGRQLAGGTVGVVGLGRVGTEIARRCRQAGLRVLGVKRTVRGVDPAAHHVDELHGPDALSTVLPRCAYLVLSCPHTPETEGMIGAGELAALPAGAVVINLARGPILDHEALVGHLRSGHLGGAALDVAAPEPLPPDSPLWEMPNVLITPHSASTVDQEDERLVDLFCDNLRRWRAGRPLRNVVSGPAAAPAPDAAVDG